MVSGWRAGFRLEPHSGGGTLVTAESTFAPKGTLSRVLAPIVRRKFDQTQKAIVAALKRSVEQRERSPARIDS